MYITEYMIPFYVYNIKKITMQARNVALLVTFFQAIDMKT